MATSTASETGRIVRFEVEKIPEFVAHFHLLALGDNYDSYNAESGVVKFKVTDFDLQAFERLKDIDCVYLKYNKRG